MLVRYHMRYLLLAWLARAFSCVRVVVVLRMLSLSAVSGQCQWGLLMEYCEYCSSKNRACRISELLHFLKFKINAYALDTTVYYSENDPSRAVCAGKNYQTRLKRLFREHKVSFLPYRAIKHLTIKEIIA